jgi:hypothetical protein
MSGRVLILTLWICISIRAADTQSDPAVALAQILVANGTITAAQLETVSAASGSARVAALASILQRKGLLTESDIAQLRTGSANAGPSAANRSAVAQGAVAPKPATPTPAPAPPRTTDIPVTTHDGAAVSLYGTVLLNAFYNTASTNIQDVPLVVNKQGSDPTGGDKNFGMTARQTRLGLLFHRAGVAGAALSGQFEFDLFGGKTPLANGMNMDIFRLRLAFGRLDWKHVAFEAGQDWSIFAPLNPTSLAAYAIPEFSESGNPWIRLPQIRAELTSGPKDATHWLWQVAANDPNMGDYPTTPFSTSRQPGIGERGRMPSIESRVAWTGRKWESDFTIGLSGTYGRGKNFGTLNGLSVFPPVDSWGVAVDYSLPFSKVFNLTGEAYIGRALGIFSVAGGEGVGVAGGPGEHGVESRGGWIQAQFNATHHWQVNLGYGLDVPDASEIPVGNRSRNQTYMGNLMYKLTPNLTFAWEYRRFLTDYRNQPFANERGDNVNLAIGYIF